MTTLENILSVAKTEFLEKGYRSASLREISKKAGVTTGALYGYFKNKEEMFSALVSTQYEHILALYREILEVFFEQKPEEQMETMQSYSSEGMTRMRNYLYDNYDEFRLILCCAEGTKYNDLPLKMAELDVEATHDFTQNTNEAGIEVRRVCPYLEEVLTNNMFEMFFNLVKCGIPREDSEEYVNQLLEFYSAGWERLMGI